MILHQIPLALSVLSVYVSLNKECQIIFIGIFARIRDSGKFGRPVSFSYQRVSFTFFQIKIERSAKERDGEASTLATEFQFS